MSKRLSLKIGISYEGSLDRSYIIELVRLILNNKKCDIGSVIEYKARTSILGHLKIHYKGFEDERVDLAFFITDQDKQQNVTSIIDDELRKQGGWLYSRSAIGVPNPHMEEWILCDEDAVKKVFNLDSSAPLPHGTIPPKNRLLMIHQESDFERTLDESKIEILKCSSFKKMTNNSSSFNHFIKSSHKAIAIVKQNRSSS